MDMHTTHRRSLMSRLPDGLILISGGSERLRNRDTGIVFRQDSNFLYLTGVSEADCLLLLDPKRRRSTLLVPRIDNTHRVWLGDVPGPAEFRAACGIERAAYADALPGLLKQARKGYRKAYADQAAWKRCRAKLRGLQNRPDILLDALDELRAVKDAGEINLLKQASRVAAQAHIAAMKTARAGMREYEVQADFEAFSARAGMRHMAFPTIVASGRGSATLHYTKNGAVLRAGDLLLLDGGCELDGYAADITRTYPVSARFTRRQADVYSVVLQAQKDCIAMTRAGISSIDLQLRAMRTLADGLKSLKLLRGDTDGLLENGAVRLFFPHGIGHLLGLDVHDGAGGKRRQLPNPRKVPIRFMAKLEPGFAFTVEPGIYFIKALLCDPENSRKHRASVDFTRARTYLDFGGIRIEDDLVVTPKGSINLTSVPKEIRDIEEIRRRA